ncbi:hypothetical protein QFC22_005811 [Naganishia vaughanmartiniae]|uniref:Uncharacterized protein n=1 Tax=Naganishia vaughanmartiniae TaxID=1424756 RepID=A0ACC2WQE1_9TREE|nr:hypothetical protein QFC22_005811 [Naganishia vaughanmartiniae]
MSKPFNWTPSDLTRTGNESSGQDSETAQEIWSKCSPGNTHPSIEALITCVAVVPGQKGQLLDEPPVPDGTRVAPPPTRHQWLNDGHLPETEKSMQKPSSSWLRGLQLTEFEFTPIH